MISEFLIDIVFGILSTMLQLLPDISWTVDVGAFAPFFQILGVAGYLLPMGTVTTIVGLVVALGLFRVVISVIKTIWDLLPVV